MSKIIFWVVVVFVILFALRLINVSKARSREQQRKPPEAAAGPAPARKDAPMVKCGNCGIYLPRNEALPAPDGYRCGDPACAAKPGASR